MGVFGIREDFFVTARSTLSSQGADWENIPEALITDCVQLVKANSIEGEMYHLISSCYPLSQNGENVLDLVQDARRLTSTSSTLLGATSRRPRPWPLDKSGSTPPNWCASPWLPLAFEKPSQDMHRARFQLSSSSGSQGPRRVQNI
jgi:hypothetical protein